MWAAMGATVAAAWAWVIVASGVLAGRSLSVDLLISLCRPLTEQWTGADVAAALAMWVAMVLAMMLPTAAPMVSTYADLVAAAHERRRQAASPLWLVVGYTAVWLVFAAAATAAQAGLAAAGALSEGEWIASPHIAGAVLIAAGVYELSPLKQACLAKCRSPLLTLIAHWRTTPAGVVRLGMEQGAYCLGCCWALMGVMFVTGVMNLLWMALLGLVMMSQKVTDYPQALSLAVAGVLIIIGGGMIVAA